ncbi:MAG TPA: Gldg family protein, partial [Planctomycetota bacterium]|nr:Gldg family protein [Planctomycetota bacterium]
MTEQPLEPSPTQPTPRRDAAEERAIFITSMTASFVGVLLLGIAAIFYWTIWAQEPGSQTPSILEYRKWFLAAGTGLTTLGILLNGQNIWEWLVRKRSLVALNVFLMTALAIALVGLIDYVTYRHFTEFDWTKKRVYSISDESIQVATNLDRDVKIAIILEEGGDGDLVRKLIDHYATHTSRISVKTLDPYIDRDETMQLLHEFGIDRPDSKREVDGVYIRSGYMEKSKDEKGETTSVWHTQKKKRLSLDDLFEESMGGPRGGGGPRKFKGEQAMTSALMEISEEKKSKIYFLTGHGELDMDGQSPNGEHEAGKFSRALKGKNYEVASLNLLQREQKDVPTDADAVVTAGADGPFDKQELDALEG